MKPPPFDYLAPDTLDGALAALAEHGADAKLLAGGQSLLPILNFRLARPSLLIDLNRVAELGFVRESADGGLRLGAMTRHRQLERDPRVAARAPLLAEAMPHVAHPQIRNRGTLGGSLAHADPSAELPALALALRMRFRLVRAGGERWIDARDFFTGLLSTALETDELLAEVEVPALPAGAGWSFLEVARRHGDYAQVGVAAVVEVDADGVCQGARWVYLSVGDGPIEAVEAPRRLLGERLTLPLIEEAAAQAARHEIDPSGDIHASAAFKRHLAQVLTRRALLAARARAGSPEVA